MNTSNSIDSHEDQTDIETDLILSQLPAMRETFHVSMLCASGSYFDDTKSRCSGTGFEFASYAGLPQMLSAGVFNQPGTVVVFSNRHAANFNECILHAKRCHSKTPLILVATLNSVQEATSAFHRGAFDLILAPFPLDELLDSIVRAYGAWYGLDADLRHEDQRRYFAGLNRFSDREKQIFFRIIMGSSTSQIAEQVGLAPKSVEKYRASIRDKMRAQGLGELLRLWRASQADDQSTRDFRG